MFGFSGSPFIFKFLMKLRIFIVSVLLPISCLISAQITTVPELPVASQKIMVTFDSSKESRLGFYTGELYAHTGVKIEGNADWQHVIGTWGNNAQPKLNNKGNGIYELEITPSVTAFYSVPTNEKVLQLAFVFRSADASQQTNNLFVNVYEDGLVVQITNPENNSIVAKNQSISISAKSSADASLKLILNQTILTQNAGKQISTSYTFTESGTFWLIAEATANNETVRDSSTIFVRENVVTEPKPPSYKKGINYPSDTSAALVLWAPLKEFVFVLGDFNNWKPENAYQMKKDGDFFWLEIANLQPNKEYIFQYLIDGNLKIADPYTEKIVDPWNDEYISNEAYPNLIQYPVGKTDGIASVLQPGQVDYNWEVSDFQIPEKEKLVIYELLIRDFTVEHTYKAVFDKLDYLEDLNINVLELMPVNEFEGNSSWGYNPSFYFAPDKYYGPKNELKKLIDECHKRGIAVVIDMVLNHSYGQSPFVQMYMDNYTILPENPWCNVTSPNQTYSWGFDFNHETAAVEELVDSINSFWINEYKIDGFRFDFTKGFTNTPGDGWAYDAPRIENLKRIADKIWNQKTDALVILEHLAVNSEETELANYGMLLWGNMSGNYTQAARGNTAESDLSNAVYSNRGWNSPNLVSYPESHDEERIMFAIKLNGLTNNNYNIKNQQTALDRIELNSLFHILLPGPKMIWQFGERGYDISINAFGGRLGEKPPYWHYLNNSNRTDLFKTIAKLNHLKQTYNEFWSASFEYNLTGAIKWYKYSEANNHVVALGNFDIQETITSITFPSTGMWYEFFSQDSLSVSAPVQNISLAPGDYRLYSTRKFEEAHVVTALNEIESQKEFFKIYPNPAVSEINILTENAVSSIQIYSITGKLMVQLNSVSENINKVNVESFAPGIYLVRVIQKGAISTKKIMVK